VAATQFNESWNRSQRQHWISVRVILLQVDVLIGELVQINGSEKWLRRLNQQDRLRKTVVLEAATYMGSGWVTQDAYETFVGKMIAEIERRLGSRLDHQHDPRCEQQHQHDSAERRLVEAPEQFQIRPGAGE
jgi:hypothetical protein